MTIFNTALLSWNPTTGLIGTGDSAVYAHSVSNNGSVVVFNSDSPNLPGAFGDRPVALPGVQYFRQLYAWDPILGPTPVPTIEFRPQADPGTGGSPGSGTYVPPTYFEGTITNRYHMTTSADGRYVVFVGDFHWHLTGEESTVHESSQVFRWDRQTNEVKLITAADHTIPFGHGLSAHPMVSDDGAYVVFESKAENLPGFNGKSQIYIWKQSDNNISLVSDAGPGAQAPATADSFLPAISGDGRYVVFESSADNLPGSDGGTQVYRWDRTTDEIVRLSDTNGAAAGGDPIGGHVAATTSNDRGEYSVWAALQNGDEHIIYHHDGVVRVVDALGPAALSDGMSTSPAISADGRFVAFESTSANLLPGFGNGVRQVFIKDMATGMVALGSATADGRPGDAASFNASISPDGTFVTYHTASSLHSGATDGHTQVYRTAVQFVTLEDTPYSFVSPLASSFSGLSAAAGTFVLDSSGVVFLPTEDFNGPVTFSYQFGGALAGFLPDGSASFTVLAVNDAPSFSFNGSPTQNVDPGSGLHSVANFVTNLDKGAANESAQSLAFLVTTDNPGLFAVGPAISADGTLSYTLAANANGSANVSVRLKDDGGTAFGGVDTSVEQTFAINANDATPFVAGTTPANGDGAFATDADITVTFSEAVTLGASAFKLMSGGTAVPFTLSGGGTSYTLNPVADLAPGASYTLTVVGAEVSDQDANDPPDHMAADHVVSFIARAPDAAPSVAATTAMDGFATSGNLTVAFSEDVAVTASSFKLMNGSTEVPFTLSGSGRIYTLNPTSDLARNTSYTLTVLADQVHDSDAIDLPDVMAADYATSFRTTTQASSFSGATLQYEWYGGLPAKVWNIGGGPQTLTVGDGVEVNATILNYPQYPWLGSANYIVDVSATTIHFEMSSSNNPSWRMQNYVLGPRFVDATNSLPRIVGATITNNTFATHPDDTPFPTNRLAVGPDLIWIDLRGVYYGGSFDLTVQFQPPTALDLDGSAGGTGFSATYIENGTRVAIADSDTAIVDAYEPNLSGATIRLANARTGDQLSFGTLPAGITVNAALSQHDLITLTGTATKEAYQNALKQIFFGSTSDDVSARTVEVAVFVGQNASNTATTTIGVTPVNDPPVLALGTFTVLEDAGAQVFTNFVANPGGGSDEHGQVVTYLLDSDRPELFSQLPAIDANGVLRFTPAADANGTTTVTVTATDNGGTENGGDNSTTTTFTITIDPVNDAPANNGVASKTGFEDLPIAITGLSISDPDAADLTVELVVTSGKLTLATDVAGGLTAAQIDNNGTTHVTITATPSQINATLAAANGLVYLGNPQFHGQDTLTITSNDNGFSPGPAKQDVDTLGITVVSVPDPPVAVDDVRTALEAGGIGNGTAGANPFGNVITTGPGADSDLDHSVFDLVIADIRTGPESGSGTPGALGLGLRGQYGTLTMNADGSYSYAVDNSEPAVQALNVGSAALTDTFTYTVMDPDGETDVAQLTIRIDGANDAPVAADDTGAAIEAGGTLNGTPGANAIGNVFTGPGADSDVDDDLQVTAVRTGNETGTGTSGAVGFGLDGNFGTLTLGADGLYTYAVDDDNAIVQAMKAGETLTDTFTYTVGAGGLSDNAQLTITVEGRNDAPVATSDTLAVTENSLVFHNVIVGDPNANADDDSDVEGDTLTVVKITDLDDAGAPVGAATSVVTPIAPGSIVTDFGAAVTALSNGSLLYDVTSANGNLAFNQLAAGQNATDTFSYTISDGELETTATVTVTITGVNDPIVAVNDAVATIEDDAASHAGNLVANDVDIDDQDTDGAGADTGDSKTITHVVAGAGVTAAVLTLDGWTLTLGSGVSIALNRDGSYQVLGTEPLAQDQVVSGSFNYTVQDEGGATSTASVSVNITGRNDAPVITIGAGDNAEADRFETDTGLTASGTLTVTDIDVTDTVTASVQSLAVSGTGAADLPGGLSDALLSFLTVAPAVVIDSGHSTGTLTWSFDSSSEAFDFLSADKTLVLTYTVRAADGASFDDQTVTVTITGANDAPVGADDTAQVDEGVTVNGVVPGVLANDTDADAGAVRSVSAVNGDGASVGSAVVGTYGTLTLNADGSYSYVADQAAADALPTGTTATDTFSYTVSDGTDTDTADLVITVTGVNDNAPVAEDDTDLVDEDAALNGTVPGVLANDTDADPGDPRTVSAVNGDALQVGAAVVGTYGTLTLNADGSYSYAADQDAADALATGVTATDTFSYTVSDGIGADTADLVITVTGINDNAPVAANDTGAVDENATLSVAAAGVLANDTDADPGDPSGVLAVNGAASNVGAAVIGTYGTLTLNADGSYSYVADQAAADALAAGVTATDTFSYTVSDGIHTDTTDLVITVTGINDAPASAGGIPTQASQVTPEQVAVAIDPAITVVDPDNAALPSATVSITGNFQAGEDVLAFANTDSTIFGNIAAAYAAGVLTLTSTGATATLAQFAAALRAITYVNTSDTPDTADRTITFAVNDGTTSNIIATDTVSVVAVNDAPVNTVPATQAVEANASTAIPGLSIADLDADAATMITTLTVEHGTLGVTAGATASGNGTASVTLTGTLAAINAALASVVYTGNHDFFGTDTLTMATNDGGNSGTGGALADADKVFIQVGHESAGTIGDDSFTAPAGVTRFEAGTGIDTMTFGFKLTDATVSYAGNEVIIDGPGGHTVLTGFEVFAFTDGTVSNNDGNALVDDLFYYSRSHDVWNAHVDADAHYNANGWHEARDPSAFFSTALYLSANPDVQAAGVDPLTHFHVHGWHEGRLPAITFDPGKYFAANPDVAAAHVDPLEHFLAYGAQEGRLPFAPSELIVGNGFDYVHYLKNNPDVAATHVDPLQHFQTFGWKEGRDPNALFDTDGYLAAYADVQAAGINPLDHYNQFGRHEGRDPSVNFDTGDYLAASPDVAAAGVNPLLHFLAFGIHEGRSPHADGVWG